MNARNYLFLFFLIALVSCTSIIPKPKSYYAQFRNPNLSYYDWDFNYSLPDGGGHTFNSSYFQLKAHHWYEGILEVPYKFNYKHEEGHIFHNQLLGVDDIDRFENMKFVAQNLTDEIDFRQSYFISVSEGIADYYALIYFHNETASDYLRYLWNNKNSNLELNTQVNQHYKGLLYTVHSLRTKEYANLTALALELGSKKQYVQYSTYLTELKRQGYPELNLSDI